MGFLREIFGPSKEEVWQELCNQIGGQMKGGFWGGNKVEIRVKEWIVTLDTYIVPRGENSTTYTRMRSPYVNKDGFQFAIYRQGFFSEVGKVFGMQDIEIGNDEFDRNFIIQGNDEFKVRQLFANQKIRYLIKQQPSIHFDVKDDEGWFRTSFPEKVDELYFQVEGIIKDVERLKSLYELFAETLNQLCNIGSAYEDDPNLRL